MMKHRVKVIAIVVMMIVMYAIASYIDTHYTREAIVTNVEQSLVTAIDDDDNVWQFKATDIHKGQHIKMIMDNNHTIMNDDDKVVNVKILVEVK